MITCLAIDDDPLFLKLLQTYFHEMKNMQLLGTHHNPVEGVMAVVKEKPDVLLLDIEMPYLNGLEMIETLDRRPKIIVISGHLDTPDLPGIGIDKYVSKNNLKNAAILEEIINEVTGNHASTC